MRVLGGEEHGGAIKNVRGRGERVANQERKEGRSRRRNPDMAFTAIIVHGPSISASLRQQGKCGPPASWHRASNTLRSGGGAFSDLKHCELLKPSECDIRPIREMFGIDVPIRVGLG